MARKAEYEIDPTDNLPMLKVQEWAKRKHRLLSHYITASSPARSRFPKRTYIDLYCGPGRCIHQDGSRTDGSAIASAKAARKAEFTEIYISDMSEDNVSACESRLLSIGIKPITFCGKADEAIDKIIACLQPNALHLAFLDPFSLHALPF